MTVSDDLMNFSARVLKPLTLKYNPASRQPDVVRPLLPIWCHNGPIVSHFPGTTRRGMELVSLSCCESHLDAY